MTAPAKRPSPDENGTASENDRPDIDPEMVESRQQTFLGFVRTSTYAAVGIALVLIALALFLL